MIRPLHGRSITVRITAGFLCAMAVLFAATGAFIYGRMDYALNRSIRDVPTADRSEIQASAILDLRLRALTALERKHVEDEHQSLQDRIGELSQVANLEHGVEIWSVDLHDRVGRVPLSVWLRVQQVHPAGALVHGLERFGTGWSPVVASVAGDQDRRSVQRAW